MIRLAHLFIAFGADKAKSKERATTLLVQAADLKLASRAHFRTLVQNHSEEEQTKNSGGDMRVPIQART